MNAHLESTFWGSNYFAIEGATEGARQSVFDGATRNWSI